jgi:hypothetical protein
VVWALAIVVVIGAGLPLAAWRLGRHVEAGRPPGAHGLGPPADAVDQWLIDQHRLPAPQRWQVRDAVLHGRTVRDPALRPAAHDLAGRVLRGELTMGRMSRVMDTVLVAEGAGLIVLGIAVMAAWGSPAGIVPIPFGVYYLVRGLAWRRRSRGAARRAHQFNA